MGALAAAVWAMAAPAYASARHTVVSHKQERARHLRPPLWQRLYVDVLLLVPTLYGYYLLREYGTQTVDGTLFRNPLLFLVPTLFVLTLTLIVVRIFPWLMRALAALLDPLPGVSLLLSFRRLAQSPRSGIAPLALLTLTLGLSTFTASMALTIDRHLYRQVYYRVGADMRLTELGESEKGSAADGEKSHPVWLFLPVSEHLRVPGVLAAARVGEFTVQTNSTNTLETGHILGIDRVDFQRVAFFQPDFAGGESLGALMNRLAGNPTAILVQRRFLQQHGLHVGDPLALTVQGAGQQARAVFTIAGVFDLFPTTYPDQGPVFVTHLDTLFQALGGEVPYDVWLRLAPGVGGKAVVEGVQSLGIQVVTAEDARAQVRETQRRAASEGVFGILSAGFLAAAFLTLLSFALVAVLSFRRRYVELGVLRALGFSQGQMALLLAVEQVTVFLVGLAAGVGLGLAASDLFIPFLQPEVPIPPFIVYIAWREIGGMLGLFGVTLTLSLAAVLTLLRHLRLFEAVKMGEMV